MNDRTFAGYTAARAPNGVVVIMACIIYAPELVMAEYAATQHALEVCPTEDGYHSHSCELLEVGS